MSLPKKTLLILGLTGLALIITLALASQLVLQQGYNNLEKDDTQANTIRVRRNVAARLEGYASTAFTYGSWDDTYNYVTDRNPEYIESNYSDDIFASVDSNLQMILANDGEVIFQKMVDLATMGAIDVPADLTTYVSPGSALASHLDEQSAVSGLILLDGRPMYIISLPILKSSGEGPVNGTYIFGRYLDVQALIEDTQLPISLYGMQDQKLTSEIRTELSTAASGDPIFIDPVDSDTIMGYTQFNDINGESIFVLAVEQERDIVAQGRSSLRTFLALFLGSMLVLGGVAGWSLRQLVLRPLARLSQDVGRVRTSANLSERLIVTGQDEIATLGTGINQMLARIEEGQAEREKLIKDLRVANRLAQENARLKSEFLSTMSHELRTPLNAIEGFTSIMLSNMGVELSPTARGMTERVSANSKRLLQLINDFLDLSRIESGRLELAHQPFSPTELAEKWHTQLGILAEKKGLEFSVDVDSSLPTTMYGDEEALSKVTQNLLSNAIKFTHKGKVVLSLRRQDSNWQIEVEDTGIGIPPHAREYIFDEFRQVDASSKRLYGGTGLGLTIVQKYARFMGGTVSVKSEVGEGSVFTVTLPLEIQPQSLN